MSSELKLVPSQKTVRDQFAKEQKCPLCQHVFPLEGAVCSGCGMTGGCEMIKCPRCGYKFVEESKIVSFFRKFFNKKG